MVAVYFYGLVMVGIVAVFAVAELIYHFFIW